jgi:hypothetical protein
MSSFSDERRGWSGRDEVDCEREWMMRDCGAGDDWRDGKVGFGGEMEKEEMY